MAAKFFGAVRYISVGVVIVSAEDVLIAVIGSGLFESRHS
jgi:hypothetical protein